MLDYNTLATDYARHRHIHPGVLCELLTIGAIGPTSHALEVGCGTGNYIASLRQIIGCACWGIDPSVGMLSRARVNAPSVTVVTGRAECLPFAGDAFDLVFSVDVIHHLPHTEARHAYFQGARRMLREGGRLCTVTDSEWIIRNRPTLSAYFPETIEPELRRYPPISRLREEMQSAGFTIGPESLVEFPHQLDDSGPFRARAYSVLHLISQDAFERGLALMERDLQRGPIQAISRYLLVWGY